MSIAVVKIVVFQACCAVNRVAVQQAKKPK